MGNYLSRMFLLIFCSGIFYNAQAQLSTYSLNSNEEVVWKVFPQNEVGKDSSSIFTNTYNLDKWIPAIVPGTVFTAYVEAGLEKDPNFGDNIYKVDKAKYNRNFWYRTEFAIPDNIKGNKVWLNFEGINRKGEVFLNGIRLGLLDGFMDRGNFDITQLVNKSQKNVLAVLVHYPTPPIPNHESPTYISSASWDWMPYVPGLLSGITDDVFLSTTNELTLADPWMRTKLHTNDTAYLSLTTDIANNGLKALSGKLMGKITPGNIEFSRDIRVDAAESGSFGFDARTFTQLIVQNPKLWWPNGYGEPNLYQCELSVEVDGKISDTKKFSFGIKEYSYDSLNSVFHLHINGKPLYVKGGNWGISEYLLRCRGDEYDLKLRLHMEMNFNMIRNWIGSTTDAEFYEACDKYGMIIWDDFWLNSHNNLPNDVFAFNHNAVEKIKRYRNHPSIAVWCGDNEGYPLPPINGWLRENIETFDGGDRWYHPNSHSDALTGSGPWTNFDPAWYFTKYPGGFGGNTGWGFRTEIGTAVFTTFESFKKFMPDTSWWPRNKMWDYHFFGPSAGNAGPDRYEETLNKNYGTATGIEDFCRKAQLLNIVTNQALFEGWQHHMWNDASGVLTWMSQSAYPSFVWQTYDYYYDLNGAYWGAKKACEPIHIQWSTADNSVKMINATFDNLNNVKASAVVYDINGKIVPGSVLEKIVEMLKGNTAEEAFKLKLVSDVDNLAYLKPVFASSVSGDAGGENAITDGINGSRWASKYSDEQWIYIDMGEAKTFSNIDLLWEAAYAKSYKIQVSNDAKSWSDVYETKSGDGNTDHITFTPVNARYVKMLGIARATNWGYSLYEFEVYASEKRSAPEVQFIRLKLENSAGNLLSENFYWRSTKGADYAALQSLQKPTLKTTYKLREQAGKCIIEATIQNPANSPSIAFAIHVQPVYKQSGESILPAIMNDDYFTLMKGESKTLQIELYDPKIERKNISLSVTPYNNRDR